MSWRSEYNYSYNIRPAGLDVAGAQVLDEVATGAKSERFDVPGLDDEGEGTVGAKITIEFSMV